MGSRENRLKENRGTGYAVVSCRDFRLQAVRRRKGSGGALVLVDDSRRQSVVLCANEEAGRFGVEAGMPSVQAIARCPGLRVERPSEAAELTAGRFLLEEALGWVPGVEETAPGLLTLDLATQPPAHWLESAWDLRGRIGEGGLDAAVGLGESPALARIAAQVAGQGGRGVWHLPPGERLQRLDELPLSVAGIGAELGERLAICGLRNLGAFARLRRAEVAARFGAEGVAWWTRLSGSRRRPLRFAKLEELFECGEEFEEALRERQPLLFLLRRFLEDLAARVSRAGLAAAAVHLWLSHADGSSYARRLALPEPTLDVELLFRLVAGHLETVEMRSAVEALRLRIESAGQEAGQRNLFGAGLSDRHRCEETLTRLRKIVGADRVGSPRRTDSHRPGLFERAPLRAELGEAGEKVSAPPATGPLLRRYPLACRASVDVRGGRPLRVESSRVSGAVEACQGPWRADGDWWHRGRAWTRVEWDVEVRGEGLFRLLETEAGWLVEGYYD